MVKRLILYVLVWGMYATLLVGCADSGAVSEPLIPSTNTSTTTTVTDLSISTSTTTVTALSTSTTKAGTAVSDTRVPATTEAVQTTKKPETTVHTTKTTTTATTSATATSTTTTTTTVTDPNRVTVNGKAYAVGDVLHYTVRIKTAENYGTVKIGVRCVQKGLQIPEGTFQKQSQAVNKNIGIGRLGSMPEETIRQNGFTMTANKGFTLDAAYSGYAGLLWFYETTNYDYDSLSYREIDCSNGVELFTIALKITKPGEYRVECMEYPSSTRTDLTVWGDFA